MNISKLIFIGFFFVLLSNCQSDSLVYKETPPKDLLDETSFKKIYKELLLIESSARIISDSGLKVDSMILINSDNYLKNNNVSRSKYQNSYDYYALNAEKFTEINTLIKKELEQKLASNKRSN